MPRRPAIDGPRENDDKGWWRQIVGRVFDQVAPSLSELDRDNFFEIAYEHFAEAGVWKLYPEVLDVLKQLRERFQLAVISNFDGRLRLILQNLGISKYFAHVFSSSELGADKPDPEIFRRALKDNAPGCERGASRRRRSRTRLESSEGGWLVSFSIRSAKKFAARAAYAVAAALGPRARVSQRRGYNGSTGIRTRNQPRKAFEAAQSSSMPPTAKKESSRKCPLSLLLHRLGSQKPERQIAH